MWVRFPPSARIETKSTAGTNIRPRMDGDRRGTPRLMSPRQQEHSLDAGFWRATFVLGAISALGMWGVVVFPIDKFLPNVSNVGSDIDWLFKFMAFFSVPIIVFVNGYVVYFAIRYRNRSAATAADTGSSIHDHPQLEFWWSVLPAALMLALGLLSYRVIPKYYAAAAAAQTSSITMEAIGYQWGFEFRYPGLDQPVQDELHLPVGVPILLDVTSKDVLHSFWMPEMRLKQDMVPGLVIPISFTPTTIGTYRIICTEFCGLGHSEMRSNGRAGRNPRVIVQSRDDYDAWYASEQKQQAAAANVVLTAQVIAAGDASAGAQLFSTKCTVCHNAAPFDQRKVGPGLGDLFHDAAHPDLVDGRPATPMDVAMIIKNGFHGDMGVMPDMQSNSLTTKEIADLVAYLETSPGK
jgi:cytochrome c oxidase subunit 2